ncbi:MAG: NAD(P)-dependent alcohol dehydrogenase [Saccharospirillaceae bacterium]|nr:NAD(P)-dependent alcohol dehydrogenase [Pseudomonadales bacterium]NRB80720.1 NAD(P)-dependent alcohol dehydrogenase [Saccharospirillaceae bacterium]
MQAITLLKYGGPKNFSYCEVPKPKPKDNEVLVKIHVTTINDYDWCMMRGNPFIYRLMFGLFKPKHSIGGMELSGEIEGIGKNVSVFNIKDHVYGDISEYGFGTFAQYICINEQALRLKPNNMSFEDACTIPHASMLAYQGLIKIGQLNNYNSNQKKKNLNILINGAGGGVGSFALNIAKQFKTTVTGVDTGEKLENMTTIGFDHVIDYKKIDFSTQKNKYDIIFDTKQTRSPLSILKSLNENGQYITVGGDLPRIFQTLIFKPLIKLFSKKRVSILALKANADLDKIEEMYNNGVIKPVIDGPYSLEKIPELIELFGNGKHTGKIVINVHH